MRRTLVIVIGLAAAFCCGFWFGGHKSRHIETFHDMLVNHPVEMSGLVTPKDRQVQALAAQLKTPQQAYLYVRDRIIDDPSQAAPSPADIIAAGRASCLGKAVLLASLYRAQGFPSSAVRIVTGDAMAPGGLFDHAWLDVEYNGVCYQQDATHVFGSFAFDHFKGDAYAQQYIRDEEYVFNDRGFAAVSQMNLLKGMRHPVVQ